MAVLRSSEIEAVDLSFKLADHEADVGIHVVPAKSRRS